MFFRKSKYKSCTQTIDLLAGFHGVTVNDATFRIKYKHLLQMQELLKGK